MPLTLLPCGPLAVMAEVEDVGHAAALARAVRALDGVVDVVGGARTVLVTVGSEAERVDIARRIGDLDIGAGSPAAGRSIDLPVTYDGPDLADVAAMSGLSAAEVIERHSAVAYTCAFCGFAPGFAYLVGLPPELRLPRRGNPRPKVPAGSVGIGAEFTGVYPTSSPGGWHLLGHTDEPMWDPRRDRPALIEPGDTVRFVVR